MLKMTNFNLKSMAFIFFLPSIFAILMANNKFINGYILMAFILILSAIFSILQIYFPDWRNKMTQKILKNELLRENRQVARLLFPYIWARGNFQMHFLAILILMGAERVAMILLPLYNEWIVDSLSMSKNLANSFSVDLLIKLAIIEVIHSNADSLRFRLTDKITKNIRSDIELDLFHHLHRLPLQWHLQKKTGEITEIIQKGVSGIWTIFDIWLDVIPGLCDILLAAIVLVVKCDAGFAALTLATMAVYMAILIASIILRQRFRKKEKKLDLEYNSSLLDSLINYETIKYYCAGDYEFQRFKEANERKINLKTFAGFHSVTTDTLADIALNIGSVLSGAMLARKISEGVEGLSAGDYVFYGNFVSHLTFPIRKFSWRFEGFKTCFIDVKMMMELLEQKVEIDEPDAKNCLEMGQFSGSIEFKNVCFGYSLQRQILHDLSFRIEAGQTLALVGESGSGKSSIIRLLFRLIEPQSGQILFNGKNIRQIPLREFREAIGVVPQDTVLFNDTIGYNIRYGRREASTGELENAAKAAQIHRFIQRHPEGYNCKVGDRGLKLSGGEKQRVAIARTILKNPNYILLDEATSSLDSKTERAIQRQFDEISRNRTCVMVAHRLSTVMNAHKILVINKGQILESGSHAELLSKNGNYAEMWRTQNEPKNLDGENREEEEESGSTGNEYKYEQSSGINSSNDSSSSDEASDSEDFGEYY